MQPKKYITPAYPYINSNPHIGHTFEFVLADVIAEYYRYKLGKENVCFGVGVDCHGQKIYDKAISEGFENTQKYCDIYSESWKEFLATLHIDYDNFYRTTDDKHKENVLRFYDEIKEHIFKKYYEGYYCAGCEAFITGKEITPDGCCSIHKQKLELKKERNQFFPLFKFAPSIKNTLIDKSKSAELANILNPKETFDLSITRQNVKWGIPAGDGSVYYVWAEALIGFIFNLGYYEDRERFDSFWNNSVIIAGSDNLKFQSFILPALLAANNIPQPTETLIHGTILDANGEKMSKSRGNVISPVSHTDDNGKETVGQIEKYGVDALRYYLFFGLNTFSDSKYSEEELVLLWNNDIVNGLGNLISRTLHLIDLKEVVPYIGIPSEAKILRNLQLIDSHFEAYDFKKVHEALSATIARLNKRINDEKPFSKDCANYADVLSEIYFELKSILRYYTIILKEHKAQIETAFVENKKVILFTKLEANEAIKG